MTHQNKSISPSISEIHSLIKMKLDCLQNEQQRNLQWPRDSVWKKSTGIYYADVKIIAFLCFFVYFGLS